MEIIFRWERKQSSRTPSAPLSLWALNAADQPISFKYWAPAFHMQPQQQTQAKPASAATGPRSCHRPIAARAPILCSYLPIVAFLAQLFLEVSQGEAVGLHHAAIRDLLPTEEVGDHKLLRPMNIQ